MTPIHASVKFGIVIRRASLIERGVGLDKVYRCMETSSPTGINEELVSFGPSFGCDAQREFMRRLEELGLIYFEDFFDLNVDHPACAHS